MIDLSTSVAASGFAWADDDGNGLRDDPGGVSGVVVTVLDNTNTEVTADVTLVNGAWSVYGLAPNTAYIARFSRASLPIHFAATEPNVGTDELLDSDVTSGDSTAYVVTFTTGAAGTEVAGINLGLMVVRPPT